MVSEKINDIEKYINSYVQKCIIRLKFLISDFYYYKNMIEMSWKKKIIIKIMIVLGDSKKIKVLIIVFVLNILIKWYL